MCRMKAHEAMSMTASSARHLGPPPGLSGYSRNTSVSANSRWVPRKIIASGGPKPATYMWYNDIATAMVETAHLSALILGAVAGTSSDMTGSTSDMRGSSTRCQLQIQKRGCPGRPARMLRDARHARSDRSHFLVEPSRALVQRHANVL